MVCTTMLKTMKNNAMNIGMDNLKSFEIQQKKKRSKKTQKYFHKHCKIKKQDFQIIFLKR